MFRKRFLVNVLIVTLGASLLVRIVEGKDNSKRYIINSNGTVVDTKTGLMWKRCAEGQSGNNCGGKAIKYKYGSAQEFIDSAPKFAGYSDWRLPTNSELRSLVYCSNGTTSKEAEGYSCKGAERYIKEKQSGKFIKLKNKEYQKPTIDLMAFPNTDLWFWDNTEIEVESNNPMLSSINFSNGLNGDDGVDYAHVRLVRSSQ